MHNLQMKDITILYEGNGAIHIPLPVAHECVVDTDQSSKSNENCLEVPCPETMDLINAHGNNSKYKLVYNIIETMTKETDHILREQFVNRITRSDSAVRKYLGIPSITMLFGIFGKLFGNIHLFKMYILIM